MDSMISIPTLVIFSLWSIWILHVKNRLEEKVRDQHATILSERSVYATDQECWRVESGRKNQQIFGLSVQNKDLTRRKYRLSKIIRLLRLREDPVNLKMSWIKTEETDVRICKARVREQLAIELENAGAIKYKIEEWDEPRLGGPQIGVTASINLLNLKYDKRQETNEQNA